MQLSTDYDAVLRVERAIHQVICSSLESSPTSSADSSTSGEAEAEDAFEGEQSKKVLATSAVDQESRRRRDIVLALLLHKLCSLIDPSPHLFLSQCVRLKELGVRHLAG